MRFQDKRLFCSQHFHGTLHSADKMMKAHAMLMNFCPYAKQTIQNNGGIKSPFEKLNGFTYRENWLENLLVATSLKANFE